MTPLPRPVARCTKCGDLTYNGGQINGNCSKRYGGKRCKGVYGSAMNTNDWAECQHCGGSGCDACSRVGWRYVRDRIQRQNSN